MDKEKVIADFAIGEELSWHIIQARKAISYCIHKGNWEKVRGVLLSFLEETFEVLHEAENFRLEIIEYNSTPDIEGRTYEELSIFGFCKRLELAKAYIEKLMQIELFSDIARYNGIDAEEYIKQKFGKALKQINYILKVCEEN